MNRLISTVNPESGTTSYSYRSGGTFCSGNLSLACTRTDARGITTTYNYETLNRLSLKAYSDGTPSAGYGYDFSQTWDLTLTNTVGRLAEIYTYSAAQGYTAALFSYDSMGRQIYGYTCLPITCWSNTGGNFVQGQGYATLTYGYDYVGDLTSATNGEGVTLTNAYNQAQRLTSITSSLNDSNHPGTLFSAAHYKATGALTSASLDNAVIGETRGYDSRMRLSSISETVGSNTLYSLTAGYALDSDVWEVNDSVTGNWTYGFDAFNRLIAVNGPNQGYTFAYDRFGNRWQQNGPHQMIESFSGNNNRMDGYSYDAAGNLLSDGTTTYTYDAENRIISATNSTNGTTSYIYDADGKRLRKTVNGVTTDYLYDTNGQQVAAVNGSGSWIRSEVYAAGRHLATYTGGTSGNTYFTFADHLGTERVRATVAGTVAESCTSLLFGDWLTCTGSDSSPMHFTGQERDSETGNDNFKARYYGSSLGRFMTPDPLGNFVADPTNPQSWNMYAYVLNNPLSYIDPTGYAGDDCNESDTNQKDNGGCGNEDSDNLPRTPPIIVNATWFEPQDAVFNAAGALLLAYGPSPSSGGTPQTPGQQSYAQCVKQGGNDFSLQGMLQSVSPRLGNSWLASTFLGNPFSSLIQAGQNFASGSVGGGLNNLAQAGGSYAVGPIAKTVPNVAFSAAATGTISLTTGTGSVAATFAGRLSAVLPFGTVAQGAANLLGDFGNLVALPVSATATSFAAVVCSIGR